VIPALGVHYYVMRDFPYSIPFLLEAGSIYIVAFAHQHRRSGYWAHAVAVEGAAAGFVPQEG